MSGSFWRNDNNGDGHQTFKDWSKENIDTSKEVVPPPSNILSECPKFRILIIGGTGVGKSTICSRVFNIPGNLVRCPSLCCADVGELMVLQVGVNHGQRGEHNINTPWTFPGLNERIVIHDSKGFEKGEQRTFNEVAEFIRARRRAVKLADQLHCIWFVSCFILIGDTDTLKGTAYLAKTMSDLFNRSKRISSVISKH